MRLLSLLGKRYTWGIGSACGRGNRKPDPLPGLVAINDHDALATGALDSNDEGGGGGGAVASVSCGGGYCMAVARDGLSLWGWGNWTGGRLGLGPVPSTVDTSYM